MTVELCNSRKIEVSNVGARLCQCCGSHLLYFLVCICEGKVNKVWQSHSLETSLEVEVSTMNFKPDERVLIVPEYVLEIDIGHHVPAE